MPSHVNPVGGSVLLQMLVTIAYEEIQKWAKKESVLEKAATTSTNGEPHNMKSTRRITKHVRILNMGQTVTSNSISFDGSHSSSSSIALAVAEALCSIDEDNKHTTQINEFIEKSKAPLKLSNQFGLGDFPEFAELFQEGDVPGANAERASDAASLTSQLLMTSPGRDSLRVVYEHLQHHAEWIYEELGIQETCKREVPMNKAPLLYIMFHIGRHPFDQFLRGEWLMPWSRLVSVAKAWSGLEGAKVHMNRRTDIRNAKLLNKGNKQLLELCAMFKTPAERLL